MVSSLAVILYIILKKFLNEVGILDSINIDQSCCYKGRTTSLLIYYNT